jgi:hypothetical protein
MGNNAFLRPKTFLEKLKFVFSGKTPTEHIEPRTGYD